MQRVFLHEKVILCSAWQSLMLPWKIQPILEEVISVDEDILRKLEERLGPLHARQRLGIETDHEAQSFGQDSSPFT